MESPAIEGDSPVYENPIMVLSIRQVGRDTWNPVWRWGDHPPRLNTRNRPIVNQYREGKAKRTPGGEWNRSWNRMLTKSRSPQGWLRTFCIMGQRLTFSGEVNRIGKPKRNRVRIGRIVAGCRPETKWSIHGQDEGAVTGTGGPNRLMLQN